MAIPAPFRADQFESHRRARGPILLSDSNPDGWRLDELLVQVRGELSRQLLALDGRLDGDKTRLLEYDKIMSALYEAEGRFRSLGPPRTSAA